MKQFIKLDNNHLLNTRYIYQIERCENDENGFKTLVIDDDNNRFYSRYTFEELTEQLINA